MASLARLLIALLACLSFHPSYGRDIGRGLLSQHHDNVAIKSREIVLLPASKSNNVSRRLNTVTYTIEVIIRYEFLADFGVDFPFEPERRGIERITQVFYLRIIAAAFAVQFQNVGVTYVSDAIVSNTALQVNYVSEITYRTDRGGVPTIDQTRAAMVSFDSNEYTTGFVNVAEPPDGLFSFCTSTVIVIPAGSAGGGGEGAGGDEEEPTPGGGDEEEEPTPGGGDEEDEATPGGGDEEEEPTPGGNEEEDPVADGGGEEEDTAPALAPEKPSSTSASGNCFSGKATVDVLGQGTVSMSALKVGEWVNVGNDFFSPVYAFGHLEESTSNEYLRVHTRPVQDGSTVLAPLEISDKHLIPVKGPASGNSRTIQADHLKVNDVLYGNKVGADYVVTKLERVTRKGSYLPLTTEGKVLVNGVVVSTYVSIFDDAPGVMSLVTKLVSEQTLFGWFVSPMRITCGRMSFTNVCSDPSMYDDKTGIWHWLLWGQQAVISWNSTSSLLQGCGVLVALAVLAFFNALEWVWTMRMWAMALVVMSYLMALKVYISRKRSLTSEKAKVV